MYECNLCSTSIQLAVYFLISWHNQNALWGNSTYCLNYCKASHKMPNTRSSFKVAATMTPGSRQMHSPISMDRSSPIPLFVQIADKLRETLQADLKSRRLRPGDPFATEKAICEQFGVSVITAKRVLDDLASEGMVIRRQGRGTFVAHPRVLQSFDRFYRFAGEVEKQGYQATWKDLRIGVVVAEAKIAKPLMLRQGAKVIFLERLRMINNEPYLLHTSYLPQTLFPGLEREALESIALYDILGQKYNRQPVRCRDTFEPQLVSASAAALLKVRVRSAGMWVERIAYDAGDQPIELSIGIIRGDRWQLTAELK
jgi:GntR family transcriptional regulator